MSTDPSKNVIEMSQRAVDDGCVNLWLSLRPLIDVTDDASNAELELFELLSEHPAVKAMCRRALK